MSEIPEDNASIKPGYQIFEATDFNVLLFLADLGEEG